MSWIRGIAIEVLGNALFSGGVSGMSWGDVPLWAWLLITGGALVVSLWGTVAIRVLRGDLPKKKLEKAPDSEMGITFFATRSELERKRPFTDQLAKAKDIYAVFVLGVPLVRSASKTNIKRLVLPNPESEGFKIYCDALPNPIDGKAQIIAATRRAQADGADVRWADTQIQHSMLIGDPQHNNGWAHIEFAPPYADTEHRFSFDIEKQYNEAVILGLKGWFDRLFEESKPPQLPEST